MEENSKLALIVAYYLSKFDRRALDTLQFESFRQAFNEIGKKLLVKPNSIKNMRDEFDPFHQNNRVGWYQRELRSSRLEVMEKYSSMSEKALEIIVREILKMNKDINEGLDQKLKLYSDVLKFDDGEEDNSNNRRVFTTRAKTGKEAEEIFIDYFNRGLIEGYSGKLIDSRNEGCGYDFKIIGNEEIFFEVKGLINTNGGVVFTDKEWDMASKYGDKYILVLINNVGCVPNVMLYKNLCNVFEPKMYVEKIISVKWMISNKDLVKKQETKIISKEILEDEKVQ